MTLVVAGTGEVMSQDEYLDALAGRVRSEYRRSREAMGEAVDAYFAIGQCLLEAREELREDAAFGAWFRVQEFAFSRQWAHILRQAAQYEPEVRQAVATQVATGGSANIKKAVEQVRAELGGGNDAPEPKKPRRSSLPDAASKAGWELRKAIERVERICADDRFPTHREQVAAGLRSHLSYVAEVMPDLLDAMHQSQED